MGSYESKRVVIYKEDALRIEVEWISNKERGENFPYLHFILQDESKSVYCFRFFKTKARDIVREYMKSIDYTDTLFTYCDRDRFVKAMFDKHEKIGSFEVYNIWAFEDWEV